MSATIYARSMPSPTYETYKLPCWRCGIIRWSRNETNLCMDCRPYAKDFERKS